MAPLYSTEKNVLFLISHLKLNMIKNVIASPGSTNMNLVRSLQNDPFFNVYSCVDERSASYMAVGMAYDSGHPVVLTCTGATASVNYLPGITEAFHRKLPIISITATQNLNRVGHNIAQVIDRSHFPSETYLESFNLAEPINDEDFWAIEIKLNKMRVSLLEEGGGPVHLNLETSYNDTFSNIELPLPRKINFFNYYSDLPKIENGNIAIQVGSSKKFDKNTTLSIEEFCEKYNAVVLCDHTSGYNGKYRIIQSLISTQNKTFNELKPSLTIQLGDITGDYSSTHYHATKIWRVSQDGKIKDTYKKLSDVFKMREYDFFNFYNNITSKKSSVSYYQAWLNKFNHISANIPDLPFSNIWVAKETSKLLPKRSVLHLGILNSLRSWNFFDVDLSISSISNVGGFGIDGNVSSIIGSSFLNKSIKHFLIVGDLAFFYDMNSIGNRHIQNNLKIILINNGVGTEFKNFDHRASSLNKEADPYIAAKGHFGNKSKTLVKNLSLALAFEYYSADNKISFMEQIHSFINSENKAIFEVFTDDDLESKALQVISRIEVETKSYFKEGLKKLIK
jgi:2-succinyl-5-enolpyruvyl-6-hydroxy-3-cyclohexene-1-carboxylate synthase